MRPEDYFGRHLAGGRFVLRSLIARSKTSLVFLADDRHDGRPVAVKVLSTEDLVVRRHFLRESRVLANHDHPHVAIVLATGVLEDGGPYMVQPYLGSDTLRARLAGGRLDWRTLLEIGVQMADALHALHLAGVIHRDVKPDNILWTRHPTEPVWVKLIDLGAAKLVGFEPPAIEGVQPLDMRATSIGYVFGTRGYRPPEAEDGEATARFDVFSLGVTLYELCAGVLPYPDLRPLADVRPGWDGPPELEAAIRKAIDLDPDRRHATADELRRELEAIRRVHPKDGHPRHLLGGRWDLLGVLGSGATATTYRAYNRELLATAAIKLLDPKADADAGLRFVREAIILRAVRHPNIPAFYELGTDAGRRYIVMELCRGTRAGEYTSTRTCLSARAVIGIGEQLTSALAALHDAGVIYRDLSIDNVLVDFASPDPKVMLIDLGASLVIEDRFYARLDERWAPPPEARPRPGRDLDLTRKGYAAPEVRAGAPWSEASDVFALGVLLYQLLTGLVPFPGASPKGKPMAIRKDCPTNLAEALYAALEVDPTKRGTIADMREWLACARDELLDEQTPDRGARASAEPAAVPGTRPADEPEAPATAAAVASPPHVSSDSQPHAPSSASRETSLAPAVEPSPTHSHRRSWLIVALLGAVLVALAAIVRPIADAAETSSDVTAPLPSQPRALVPPDAATKAAPALAPVPAEPDAATLLAGAEGSLRACAKAAGRGVTVELAADAGASHFTTIKVLPPEPALERCVRDVLEPLRFAAQPSATTTITRYRP